MKNNIYYTLLVKFFFFFFFIFMHLCRLADALIQIICVLIICQ